MITAIDTSVLLDVLLGDPRHGRASVAALRQAAGEGRLVACAPVWAETHAAIPVQALGEALADLSICFDALTPASAAEAGRWWARYRARGRARRDRIFADFLIGAHAHLQADRLLTRDRGFFRDCFDGLEVIDPSATPATRG